MIQNINFPEGTKVYYQRGGFYDQFNKDMIINTSTSVNKLLSDGFYIYSQLSSAKEFTDMHMDYCFYSSDCIFRINKTTSLSHTFDSGIYMYDLIMDKNISVLLDATFNGAKVPAFFTISATASTINSLLSGYNQTSAIYINWDIDTSNITTISNVFGQYTKAIYGFLSIKNVGNVNYYTITGYSRNSNLRCITLADVGTNSSQRTVDCSYWDVWGVNTSAIPEARQSLIDSLITYSFDRAAAGYSTCTIKLSAKTKALLTEEEIAQITAKGFTIA